MVRDPRVWGLSFMAAVCLAQAVGYAPWADVPDQLPFGLESLSKVMPIWVYALLWLGAFLGTVRNAFTRSRDVLFIALPSFPALLWAVAYIVGWAFTGFHTRDWRASVIYWVISGAICCFGLVRPAEPKAGR